jgi:uncharacterized surface protein with fasciclin (FAS1) repeats
MPQRKIALALSIALAALLLTTTAHAQTTDTIMDELRADNRFDTLVAALEYADLDDDLDTTTNYTLFAPVDDAWDLLPNELEDDLLDPNAANYDTLEYILRFHVLVGDTYQDEVNNADTTLYELDDTLLGADYFLILGSTDGVEVLAHGAELTTTTPIDASNGSIYPIDNIMVPPNRPDAWPGLAEETVTITSDLTSGRTFWYIDWDGDGDHSVGTWETHYWDDDLVVEWEEYDFPEDVNGAYRMSIHQYDLVAGDAPLLEIKVAYHWQRNPNPTLFTFGALADGEPLIVGHPVYVLVQPATYTTYVDSMTGVTEYEYELIEDADPQWSQVISWGFLPGDSTGRLDGILFIDVE